jgi:hypothetical protein
MNSALLPRRGILAAGLLACALMGGRAQADGPGEVECDEYDPGVPFLTLYDPVGERQVSYDTATAQQAGAVVTVALSSTTDWTCCEDPEDDLLEVGFSVTGTGTMPALDVINVITLGTGTVTFNSTTRTFASDEDATEMALAVLAARLLPSGADLSQAGYQLDLTVSLLESWITN